MLRKLELKEIVVELFNINRHSNNQLKIGQIAFIVAVAYFFMFFAFNLLYYYFFPPQEKPVEVVVKDLATVFKQNRFKYVKTVNLLRQIDDSFAIDIVGSVSQKQLPYRLYYEPSMPNNKPINDKYPLLEVELDKIWRGTLFGGSFSKKFVRIGIRGDQTLADLLYTTIPKDEFISHFRDSMEYCVYPEIPKSQEHWIVKLEDNWYIYDGYFRMKLE